MKITAVNNISLNTPTCSHSWSTYGDGGDIWPEVSLDNELSYSTCSHEYRVFSIIHAKSADHVTIPLLTFPV